MPQTNPVLDTQWGAFRKWLSAHPLTGFWVALVAGFILGAFIL